MGTGESGSRTMDSRIKKNLASGKMLVIRRYVQFNLRKKNAKYQFIPIVIKQP